MIISKNSPNEFYNYATFIDILQSRCHYIIFQVLVWKWHLDYRLDTARLDTTEYIKKIKVAARGKVPSLLARILFLSYCLLCTDIVYVISVVINNIRMYFSFIHASDLIIELLEMFHVHSSYISNVKNIKGNI